MVQERRENGIFELSPEPFRKMVSGERLRRIDILFRGAALGAGGFGGRCGLALDVDDIN